MTGHSLLLFQLSVLAATTALVTINLQGVGAEELEFPDLQDAPTESQCRPYIEKALKQRDTGESTPGAQDTESPGISTSAEQDEQLPTNESGQEESEIAQDQESEEEASGGDEYNIEALAEQLGGQDESAEYETIPQEIISSTESQETHETEKSTESQETREVLPSIESQESQEDETIAATREKRDTISESVEETTATEEEQVGDIAVGTDEEVAVSTENVEAISAEDVSSAQETTTSVEEDTAREEETRQEETPGVGESIVSVEEAPSDETVPASEEDGAPSAEEIATSAEGAASDGDESVSTEKEAPSAEEESASVEQAPEAKEVPAEEEAETRSTEEEDSTSVEEGAAIIQEGAADGQEDIASAEESIASAEDGHPSAEEGAPSAEEVKPDSIEESSAEDAAPPTVEELHSAEEIKGDSTEESSAEDGAPPTVEEAPSAEDIKIDSTEESSAEDAAPPTVEEAPSAEEIKIDSTEESSAEDATPPTVEEAPSAEDATEEAATSDEEVKAASDEAAEAVSEEEVTAVSAEEGVPSTEEISDASTEEAPTGEEAADNNVGDEPHSGEVTDASVEEAAVALPQPSSEEITASSAEEAPTTASEEEGPPSIEDIPLVSKEDVEEKEVKDDEAHSSEKAAEEEETAASEEEAAIQVEGTISTEEPASGVEESTPSAEEVEPESSTESETIPAPETVPEEDLTLGLIIPENLRPRDHITKILQLDSESAERELLIAKTVEVTLKELKKIYDNAIKPLEVLYKYRDLSNRHFGDPEIFSKPLILFMGPWSGGKSSIINYLLDNEYKETALRTGAEPSPAYFNILMWGDREEVIDGTQLAADWTFSGLQKFGQGLLDRLRGLRLPNQLLDKVNIVEIPGILEIRKQVERLFPFNDACQWFIDRADIIFLVYDPAKLDVGPETEAILDQLKGREYQTRIILNKADQVRPEELMRVQGTLIWNISPLMSSSEPPVMYSTSLWSLPYESGAPMRLLQAQERAFLRDMRNAIDKRVENKIASARRFAVRVRNHAKMVDCYLTTYYNHKGFFGNRKKVSDDIIERPQDYHIYEGLSTLKNISRYDLPDPDVYRDFFRLNSLYDFQQLSATCTYFRGCPINRLDVAIAYDLPELVGKYKKSVDEVLTGQQPSKS